MKMPLEAVKGITGQAFSLIRDLILIRVRVVAAVPPLVHLHGLRPERRRPTSLPHTTTTALYLWGW